MTLFSQRSLWRQKYFGLIKPQLFYCSDETNKTRSHLSNVPVKKSLASTRTAYSGTSPIKGPTKWNRRTVVELEEDADWNLGVCKFALFLLLSEVMQTNSGLGWLFVEVHRSHTVIHRQTRYVSSKRVTKWSQWPLPKPHKQNNLKILLTKHAFIGIRTRDGGNETVQNNTSDRSASRFDVHQ